jgi:archaellum component FlaG (FlaF/FlaG flagellin family)
VLLITVSLAAAAWTYISGYWGGLVGSAIEVTSVICQGGVNATIYIHNIGTQRLNMNDLDITRTDGGGTASYVFDPSSGMLDPGKTGKIKDITCTTAGSQQRCSYDIVDRAGRLHQPYTTCTG